MFRYLSDRTKATTFYTLAFVFSTAVVPLAPLLGTGVTAVAMLTPLLAVRLMLLPMTRDGYTRAGWGALGLHRAGIHSWGLALLVPLIVLGFSYGALWLSRAAILSHRRARMHPLNPPKGAGQYTRIKGMLEVIGNGRAPILYGVML